MHSPAGSRGASIRQSLGHKSHAPGVKSVRWLKPTFVDDELTLVTEIADKFPSKSRPQIGFCFAKHRLEDQHGTAKMVMENNFMIGRRPA